MKQLDILRRVVTALESLGVDYAVVGSFASGAWGEPRMTQDIDILVAISPDLALLLSNALAGDEFYLSKSAVEEAVRSKGQFNLIHPASGNKVDFMVADGSAWTRTQLSRAKPAALLEDRSVRVAAPEDVILDKLINYREGGSEKHIRDITGILRTGVTQIDHEYLTEWTQKLGLTKEWGSILRKLSEES